jgi:hypothetical protein
LSAKFLAVKLILFKPQGEFMKFLLTALLLTTTLFSTAQAGDPISGRLTLSDGTNIFRISIGDERDQRPESLIRRVRNLEQAVGELQMKVYDLEREPVRVEKTVYVCSTQSDFNETFLGEGDSLIEAKANAVLKCEKRRNGMFCKNKMECSSKTVKL